MNLFSTKLNATAANLGLLILRLTAGGLMIHHGYQKLVNIDAMKEKFMNFMGLGVTTSIYLTIFAEFFCAIFLVIGLFTRFAAVALAITMFVALFIAHKGEAMGDGEMAAIYLGMYVAILIMGPARYSVDGLISKK